jgi:hypothetical protein
MNRSRLLTLLFCVLVLIEIASLAMSVSVPFAHGISADEAFNRWNQNRTPQNELAFRKEMDRLLEQPRKIRKLSFVVFCANSIVLWFVYRRLDRIVPPTGNGRPRSGEGVDSC